MRLEEGNKPTRDSELLYDLPELKRIFLDPLFSFEEFEINPSFVSVSRQLRALYLWTEISLERRFEILNELQSLYLKYPPMNWVGIYRRDPKRPNELIVSAYVGEVTPHERIPVDRGICGAAVREEQSINVADVKSDPRYLSCSITTKSELVVPIRDLTGKVQAEIDIDSSERNFFDSKIQEEVERLSQHLSTAIYQD